MKLKTYNQNGEESNSVELSDTIFGLPWNGNLVQQVVVSQQSNVRQGTAHTKTRREVSGGGKKPWRQKGTGRARHGSTRSPIWVGGGVAHGPRTEKNYHKKINKKMAKKALYTVFSAKARDTEVIVLDALTFSDPKTKQGALLFDRLEKISEFGKLKKGKGVLVALPGKDQATRRVLRNLPYVGMEDAKSLNARKVLSYKYILFPREVIEVIGN